MEEVRKLCFYNTMGSSCAGQHCDYIHISHTCDKNYALAEHKFKDTLKVCPTYYRDGFCNLGYSCPYIHATNNPIHEHSQERDICKKAGKVDLLTPLIKELNSALRYARCNETVVQDEKFKQMLVMLFNILNKMISPEIGEAKMLHIPPDKIPEFDIPENILWFGMVRERLMKINEINKGLKPDHPPISYEQMEEITQVITALKDGLEHVRYNY